MRELVLWMVLAAILLYTMRDPFYGLSAYLGFNVIRPEMLFWGEDTGNVVFKLVMLATMVSFLFQHRAGVWPPARCRPMWLILWMYLALLVSLLTTNYTPHPKAYDYALEIFKLFIIGWIYVALMDNKEKVLKFQNYLLLLFGVLCLWGLEQKLLGNERIEKLSGFDSNELASMFVLFLPLALNLSLNGSEKRVRILAVIGSALFISGIIGTMSRTGFIGLFIVLCGMIIAARQKMLFLAVLALALLAGSFFVSNEYLERMNSISSETRDYSAGSRVILWKAGLMVFRDHPLFGAGFLTFHQAKLDYVNRFDEEDPGLVQYSFLPYKVGHNTYVQGLSEGGLFFFLPYLTLLSGAIVKNWRCLSRYRKSTTVDPALICGLESIQVGIVACCACFFFFNLITNIFLPLQVLSAFLIRERVEAEADQAGAQSSFADGHDI